MLADRTFAQFSQVCLGPQGRNQGGLVEPEIHKFHLMGALLWGSHCPYGSTRLSGNGMLKWR